ncbi:MAG: HAMP domain-containing sensor histidine kinase [Desulfatiglandales bacterium]
MASKEPSSGWTLGILPKLLISFLILSMIPLIGVGYLANKNLKETGRDAIQRAEEMGKKNLQSAVEIGKEAIDDSVRALDEKSTEAIELRTVELAQRIAEFLYERDRDILMLASFEPEAQRYLDVYRSCVKDVIVHGPWPPRERESAPEPLHWQNEENKVSWRQRPPCSFKRESRPLYKEITFIDLQGNEKIKIVDGRISKDLRRVSIKENTYCRAEDYYSHLHKLDKNELYVSRVIGPYVKGWLYTDENAIKVKPESAYAGKENPGGERFEGIVRWATPVFGKQGRTGYVTLALDHTHLMEFTDHIVPTEERFSDISDAGSGNYAWLWDDQDQCISHPRDFFICGYDPDTGKEVPGWLSQETYDEYKESGLTLEEFVQRLPSFRNFSFKKPGSKEQVQEGCIALDCRVLDTAPQCQGWHTGTEDGGSGSFLIFWSSLWKLTTYATVPYYTGPYGNSNRGFGYVTLGANVDDFHKAANITRENIEMSIAEQGRDIEMVMNRTRGVIDDNSRKNRLMIFVLTLVSGIIVAGISIMLSLNITTPLKRLTRGADAISRGNLNQHIEISSRDEIGKLARSFNEMAAAMSEVDRMKSEFVTIASHELRTPIHAMLLAVSGLLEGYAGAISDEVREDLEVVDDGIVRLRRLIDDLLDLSRIEARKIEINIARISIGEIVSRAVEEVRNLAEAHRHVIMSHIPDDLSPIRADRDRILQVIINLLSNSIKYSPDGAKIIIGVEDRGDDIVFSVADNGYGIPPWAQEKVFEKFFQADSIMSQKVGGSGLGLNITKGIVEEHGGSIRLQSPLEEGRFPDLPLGGDRRGTLFIVTLPKKGPKPS